MKQLRQLLAALFLCILMTGCWDRTEINDFAFWMGTAIDKTSDDKIKVSAQIAIPKSIGSASKQGGQGESTIVVSAAGKTLLSTCQAIQNQLPRRLFIGHRRSVFLSDSFARAGMSEFLDMYTRNPELSLRTGMFVVLGKPPEEILKFESPFNPFSSDAVLRQDKFAKMGDVALRDFLINFSSQSMCPVLSAIDISQGDIAKKDVVNINKLAVFNKKAEMVGLLTNEESLMTLWIIGRLKVHFLTAYVPEGKGYVTVDETNLKTKISTKIEDGKHLIQISLSGVGTVRENNTTLDLSDSRQLAYVETALNRHYERVVMRTVRRVQDEYRTDIFGFGERLHQEHPEEWKRTRKDWENKFAEAHVSVKIDTNLNRIGVNGPPPKAGSFF
ncbi:Ger(x)C family spore germination protein [Paenibacillus antri]|uniref:Ger(X)C family spore germination protein n=1 Tax=Paenibacillus antri TaxID=2582848 RepID=A0A5R9GDR1_9BACL|nr:Ger(x)C family spore germination protein [Paenibacillus antri]TLS50783.1 Ger(x)C family spore germination protein [Paenibacillus antri]